VKFFFPLIALLFGIVTIECIEQYRAERCSSTGGDWQVGFFDVCVYPQKGNAK